MPYPLVHEIPFQPPRQIFAAFSTHNGAILLESAQVRAPVGRYSFIAVHPFAILSSKNGLLEVDDEKTRGNPFNVLAEKLAAHPLRNHADLPPFQGGVAGFLSYDAGRHLENLPRRAHDDMQFPDMQLGFYDVVIGFDLVVKKAWVFSSGFPAQDEQRLIRARERLAWMLAQLMDVPALPPMSTVICDSQTISANFTSDSYQAAVSRVIAYILAGDIFEANISQRFHTQLPVNLLPFELYRRLCALNPAPFAGFMAFGNVVLISASPERFLKLTQGIVEARPIKGTRSRSAIRAEDLANAEELLASEKDRAENIMIVDLLRNDLSRVCRDHSVEVPQLCGLESFATVHHLVSVVQGELHAHLTALDLLRATFPGGSITGAPKIRAMEIIEELEPNCRGPYCGSMGYIGFNGDMDLSITIRTFAFKNGVLTFQAGGAVVADSDPAAEFAETLTKASALHRALTSVQDDIAD
jgi:para-aminobenzoate synthetase component 1